MPTTTNSPALNIAIIAEKLPQTYQKALLRLAKTMLKQSEKGKAKYGIDIDQNTNQSLSYWLEHADEELADFLVYQEKIREITLPKMEIEKAVAEADCKSDLTGIQNVQINNTKQELEDFEKFKTQLAEYERIMKIRDQEKREEKRELLLAFMRENPDFEIPAFLR
jgi:hypothetical protein